ncbi:sugar transferase, partial [Patescibacteria group bacterium]|nr:sugar transferase [Patescibacteria group bacterium]
MNKFQLTFTALKLPVDFVTLACASAMAYLLRYSRFATEIRPILQDIPISTYIQTSLTFIAIWIVVFIIAGLYSARQRRAWDELGRIILACTAGVMLLIASIFFRRELTQSRFIILAIWALSVFFVFFGRLALRTIQHQLLRMRMGHDKIAIIGSDLVADNLVKIFNGSPILGFTVACHANKWTNTTKDQLKKLVQDSKLNGIVLADPDMPKKQALHVIGFANKHHLHFWYAADIFAARFTNIAVSTPGGIPLIEVKPTPLDGWGRIAKRFEDIFFSIIILLISSPLWLFGALLVLFEDGFPIIYKSERIGERGKSFITYKLRTMFKKFSIGPQFKDVKKNLELEQKLIKEQSIKKGAVYKIANDPRIMKTGNFLRRWSIDEFPNFISVLKGDMSLVGPRPHQPREVEKYTDEQRRVLTIKPGVTGLAQIS